ncbi:MAG: caspase family protein, partial [Hyphomicrobium sp.]
EIHRVIRNRQAHIGIIVLDACRNNPLRIAERDNPYKDAFPGELVFGKDLGRIVPPVTSTRMLGLYSAEHGQRALDRLSENDNNPNSPFTRVLIKSLVVPGVELRNAVVELQSEVYGLTQKIGYDQAPAYYDQMRGLRVYLAGPPAALIQLPTSPAPPPKYFAVEPAETAPGPQRAECAPVPPAASTPEAQARLAMIDADWHKALDAATGRTAKAVEGFLKVRPESWRACEAIAVFNELGVFEAALKDAQPVAALEHYVATFGGKALQGVAARHRIDELRYAEKKAACDSIVKAAMVTVAEARNEGCDIGGEHWGTNPVIQTSRCLLASPEGRDGEVSRRQTELAACKDDKAEDKAFAVAMAVAGGQSPHGTAKTSGKATAAKSGQSLQGTAGASPELANVHTGIAGLRNGVAAMDGFLKAWPQRRRAVEAGAEKARLESAIEPLLASIRDIDRAKWAEAERSPLEVAGYNAYLAMLPEGESRELAKAAKADLEACNAAVAADDVAQMKAYRDNFPDGRCRSRLAALIAPPTDLT